MAKEPATAGSANTVDFIENRNVLRPEDVLSDPAGESVFLPPGEDLAASSRSGLTAPARWPPSPGSWR